MRSDFSLAAGYLLQSLPESLDGIECELLRSTIRVPGVCQSACLSRGFMSFAVQSANTAERIEVLLVLETFRDLRNIVLDGSPNVNHWFNAPDTVRVQIGGTTDRRKRCCFCVKAQCMVHALSGV